MNMKKKLINSTNKNKEKIISVFYSFRQSTKIFFTKNWEFAANLDPFYIFGFAYLFQNFRNKEKFKKSLYFIIPIVVYAIFQILMLQHLNVFRLFINCLKIIICIFCMLYVKDNYQKISIYKIVKYSTILIFVVTLIAILFDKSSLWRFNDYINKYSVVRLQGLFLEPSELGFHIMILIIFLVGYFLNSNDTYIKKEIISLVLINTISLFFARPFGAIVIGLIAIIFMLIYDFIINFTKKKLKIYLLLFIAIFTLLIFGYIFKSGIVLRMIDTITGNDLSNNYRISVSLNILKQSFLDYGGLGFGFGNLNTPTFAMQYRSLGLANVVANSFQYFIIEGGIFSIIFLILLWKNILLNVVKNKSHAKVGLLVFLFLYQIFGGHFTSALIWALYGLCISKYKENLEL